MGELHCSPPMMSVAQFNGSMKLFPTTNTRTEFQQLPAVVKAPQLGTGQDCTLTQALPKPGW